MAKAAFDFVYRLDKYDPKELNPNIVVNFKKGETLPEELVKRLKELNAEHLDFSVEAKEDKKEDKEDKKKKK